MFNSFSLKVFGGCLIFGKGDPKALPVKRRQIEIEIIAVRLSPTSP